MVKRRIGFIGTGSMGFRMARRLAQAGHDVRAWDRTREQATPLAESGVAVVRKPIEVAADAEFVVAMLNGAPACDAVLFDEDAVTHALPKGAVVIVMSSIPVATARLQGERAAALGLEYLDAPVSGAESDAEDGTLAIMVGGGIAAYERAREVLEVMGRPAHVGPIGTGQLAKLADQAIVTATLVAVAEALVLARAGGADPARVREALLGGLADSTVLRRYGWRMVRHDVEPGESARHRLGDQDAARALARSLGVELPMMELVAGLFEEMIRKGHGDRDQSAIYLEIAERNRIGV